MIARAWVWSLVLATTHSAAHGHAGPRVRLAAGLLMIAPLIGAANSATPEPPRSGSTIALVVFALIGVAVGVALWFDQRNRPPRR